MDCCISTIAFNDDRLFVLSKDQTNIIEFNLINHTIINRSAIQLNSSKIIQMYSIACDHLVFHNHDKQIYLWQKENQRLEQLEDALHIKIKDNLLVLISTNNKTIILYDLQVKSRQIGQLDDNAGQCEALCLSNINQIDKEQYLFLICSDRLLRMYRVLTGEQMVKIFINTNLYPFLGIINDRLLLKIDDHLCIIQIIDRKSMTVRSTDVKCSLFEQTDWLRCHDYHFA
jgi:hypothetical protein